MRAHRTWRSVGEGKREKEVERLRSELGRLKDRIDELERQHSEARRIEQLRQSERELAGQLDEVSCAALADQLKDLLRK